MLDISNNINISAPENRCVVRLKTSSYSTKKGIFATKSLQYAKRLSYGFNILQEDISNTSAEDVINSLTNLNLVPDGFMGSSRATIHTITNQVIAMAMILNLYHISRNHHASFIQRSLYRSNQSS